MNGCSEEGSGFNMIFEDMGEERIRGEKEVHSDWPDCAGGKPVVSFFNLVAGQFVEILKGNDQIDGAGGSPINVLEHGHRTDEKVGDAMFVEALKESAGCLGKI